MPVLFSILASTAAIFSFLILMVTLISFKFWALVSLATIKLLKPINSPNTTVEILIIAVSFFFMFLLLLKR
ncbi:hypothetical protein D3C86_1108760 [compost metagenome]